MMQDVSERGAMRGEPRCLIFKKTVPPHGRSYAGIMGWLFFFPIFFFFGARFTLMTNLCFGRRKPRVEPEPCPALGLRLPLTAAAGPGSSWLNSCDFCQTTPILLFF